MKMAFYSRSVQPISTNSYFRKDAKKLLIFLRVFSIFFRYCPKNMKYNLFVSKVDGGGV